MTYCWVIVDAPWVALPWALVNAARRMPFGSMPLVGVEGAVLGGDRRRPASCCGMSASGIDSSVLARRTGRPRACRRSSRRRSSAPRSPCSGRGSRWSCRRSRRTHAAEHEEAERPPSSSHFRTRRRAAACLPLAASRRFAPCRAAPAGRRRRCPAGRGRRALRRTGGGSAGRAALPLTDSRSPFRGRSAADGSSPGYGAAAADRTATRPRRDTRWPARFALDISMR